MRALALLLLAVPSHALRIERITGVLSQGQVLEVAAEEALVKFSTAADGAARGRALAALGASEEGELEGIGWTRVRLPPGMRVAAAIARLQAMPEVENVQPNHVYRPTRTPNDPYVSAQYALSQINMFPAWEYDTGNANRVTIAVIDTGIQSTNDELSGKLLNESGIQSQFFNPNAGGAQSANHPPTPACNHATRVAGIAAAAGDNGSQIAGLSWGAKLLSLKVFADGDCNPAGGCPSNCGTTDSALANAVAYARIARQTQPAATGRVVINMSIGGTGGCPGTCPGANCFQATRDALTQAVAAGIPIAISAGNDGGAVNVPANCAGTSASGIIPVGATNSSNEVAGFSSRGPELAANGVVAPGVNVLTTDLDNFSAQATGTSFASPHVAGLAALILSAQPGLTALQVQSIIRGGAASIGVAGLSPAAVGTRGDTSGAGRLDAFRTMRLAVNGSLAEYDGDVKAIAFPNPFRVAQAGNVTFTVPVELQGAQTKVRVYTPSGVLIRELTGLSWDGKNSDGLGVSSGTYLFLVTTSKGHTTGRLTLIR